MNEYGPDISKDEAVNILLEMYQELRDADMIGNEDKCIALMMGITALAWISVNKLYQIAPHYWHDREETTS